VPFIEGVGPQAGQLVCCLDVAEGIVNVQFFERDLQLTEAVAVPEPAALSLMGVALLLTRFTRRKRRA
jgi:hypothetical protein